MFFMISNALKKRFVVLFQDIFRDHPIFDKVVVVNKFPKEDRPKHALLIRSIAGSGNKLGLDNFVQHNISYSSLANLKDVSGNSIEWVKDDVKNEDKLSAPGFYIVRIVSKEENSEKYSFVVDPYLLIDDEILNFSSHPISGEIAQTKYTPINPGSETVFSDDGIRFKRDIDYTIDYENGKIITQVSLDDYGQISIDYQAIGQQLGPFEIEPYLFNNIAIPGVILAFGDRLKVGDEQVVIVDKEKRINAKVFGGRFILNVDLIGISQDTDQQERIVDFAIAKFWADWQEKLVDEGINIYDFSLSGEAEDLEVEIPEEYNYTGGISFTAETDWELHSPVVSEIRDINYDYGPQSYKDTISNINEANYENNQYDSRMINAAHQVGIQIVPPSDPVVVLPNPFIRKTRIYRTAETIR